MTRQDKTRQNKTKQDKTRNLVVVGVGRDGTRRKSAALTCCPSCVRAIGTRQDNVVKDRAGPVGNGRNILKMRRETFKKKRIEAGR